MCNRVVDKVAADLRAGRMGKLAAAQLLEQAFPKVEKLPTKNGISMFLHCSRCLECRPEDQSPADWARLSIGFTKEGLQVWCWRHGINVAHIHFEGMTHPCNTGATQQDKKNMSSAFGRHL
jgi:hypothetical protein